MTPMQREDLEREKNYLNGQPPPGARYELMAILIAFCVVLGVVMAVVEGGIWIHSH